MFLRFCGDFESVTSNSPEKNGDLISTKEYQTGTFLKS